MLKRVFSCALLSALTLSVAACGGPVGPKNRQPTANAGPDRVAQPETRITLQGTGTDPDGDTLSYRWQQMDGPAVQLSGADGSAVSFAAPSVAPAQSEAIGLRLTVTDPGGLSASDDVLIVVQALNRPPLADAGADQTMDEGEIVIVNGSGSDPDGDLLSYRWEQLAGPTVALSGESSAQESFDAPQVPPTESAVVGLRLTVTDQGGLSASDSVQITVRSKVRRAFVHTATADNIYAPSLGTETHIDHPLLNDRPDALLLVTRQRSVFDQTPVFNYGVGYRASAKRWYIRSMSLDLMPDGARFNVRIITGERGAFLHTSTSQNVPLIGRFPNIRRASYSMIDCAFTNSDSNAFVMMTPVIPAPGVDANHALGVRYYPAPPRAPGPRWAVFNQDGESMSLGLQFHVWVIDDPSITLVHTHQSGGLQVGSRIEDLRTDGQSEAILFVTQNFNPSGLGAAGDDSPFSVEYQRSAAKWAIRSDDNGLAEPKDEASFNVLIQ